jgi:predicted nucleic acid-binding protein
MVEPTEVPVAACRDSSDLMVLGTAIAGSAECIVTGDKDLLVIRNFGEVAILSPRAFYQRCSR